MRLWDTIKKPFKWWHEFLQRHKTFRGIWWFTKGGGIIILFLFLVGWIVEIAPIHTLEDLWGFTILLGALILSFVVDPVGTINEISGGKLGDRLLNALLIFMAIAIILALYVSWRRGAGFRRWKKLDEEMDETPVSTSESARAVNGSR